MPSLYAKLGIPNYWIVNPIDRQLEIYREPTIDQSQVFGHGYAQVTIFKPGDKLSPLLASTIVIDVDDLLP